MSATPAPKPTAPKPSSPKPAAPKPANPKPQTPKPDVPTRRSRKGTLGNHEGLMKLRRELIKENK